MVLNEREGVIKFDCRFESAPPFSGAEVKLLSAWRRILFALELIGRDPRRYQGLGFGNLSLRLPPYAASPAHRPFLITGTQTGELPDLGPQHYAVVTECHPERNRVVARGPLPPSSESLTHGTLYGCDPALRCVVHVHSPLLWRQASRLGVPTTDPGVAYGTPEMAAEVVRLMGEDEVRRRRLFAMGGHEDGLVSFGEELGEAVQVLMEALAAAYALE